MFFPDVNPRKENISKKIHKPAVFFSSFLALTIDKYPFGDYNYKISYGKRHTKKH